MSTSIYVGSVGDNIAAALALLESMGRPDAMTLEGNVIEIKTRPDFDLVPVVHTDATHTKRSKSDRKRDPKWRRK